MRLVTLVRSRFASQASVKFEHVDMPSSDLARADRKRNGLKTI